MTTHDPSHPTRRRRAVPLLWVSGALAAVLLVLGVSGTLSSWTSAILNNTTNTTSATGSVALSESQGGTLCVDTSTTTTNTADCTTVNKYGGTAVPLVPGVAGNTTTVSLSNTGSVAGDLTLTAAACTPSAGIPGAADDLCDFVGVVVECPAGTGVYSGTLSDFAGAGAQVVTNLAAGASVSCAFTVSLPSTAPADIAAQVASQPLTWTLTKS